MAWTAPDTYSVGQLLTAAAMNKVSANLRAVERVGKLEYVVALPTAIETVVDGGWLECNGVDISRTTYASLWSWLSVSVARTFTATTLGAAITTTSTTSVTLAAYPSDWPNDARKFLIQVDSEKLLVTAGFGTTSITVTRAAEGTGAATHLIAAAVTGPTQSPFGHGDGSTTYTLPNFTARMPVAAASGGNTDVSQLGGSENSVLGSRRPKHRHSYGDGTTFAISLLESGTGFSGDAGASNMHQKTVNIGPQSNSPGDTPAYLVGGIWRVKF